MVIYEDSLKSTFCDNDILNSLEVGSESLIGQYKEEDIKTSLPYSDKREQLLKITRLVNEQNVSVTYIDINAISLYLDLNIFQQDECFCSKLGMEVEYAKSNLKTSLSQIWVICQLLPFVRVGQI